MDLGGQEPEHSQRQKHQETDEGRRSGGAVDVEKEGEELTDTVAASQSALKYYPGTAIIIVVIVGVV